MAEEKKETTPVDVENVEANEMEDQDLEEVSGGAGDTNCNCIIKAE